MANNDHFAAVPSSAVGGSNRPTMPSVGGGPRGGRQHSGRAAAAALRGARPDPTVDEPLSASLERFFEERYNRKVRLSGSTVGAGAGFAWMSLLGPADGFVWNVRRINVGPVDYTSLPFATGITVLAVVAGQQQPPAGSVSADLVASVSTGWPAEATWGPGELTLEGGDYLWVAVAGVTANVPITAGGQAYQTAVHVPEIYGL